MQSGNSYLTKLATAFPITGSMLLLYAIADSTGLPVNHTGQSDVRNAARIRELVMLRERQAALSVLKA